MLDFELTRTASLSPSLSSFFSPSKTIIYHPIIYVKLSYFFVITAQKEYVKFRLDEVRSVS